MTDHLTPERTEAALRAEVAALEAALSRLKAQAGVDRDVLRDEALLACEEAIYFVSELSMCSEPMLVGALVADRDSYDKAREALRAWRRGSPGQGDAR